MKFWSYHWKNGFRSFLLWILVMVGFNAYWVWDSGWHTDMIFVWLFFLFIALIFTIGNYVTWKNLKP